MKKLIFTLMMMAGLALIAGTAMGQDATSPYEGSTHTYSVGGIDIGTGNTGTVSVFLSSTNTTVMDIDNDATNLGWSISNSSITGGGSLSLNSNTDYTGTLTASETIVEFDLTYTGTNLSEATRYIVLNVITDGECSNFITLEVTPIDAPTLELAVTSDTDQPAGELCQVIATSPTNDTPASSGQTNTIVYTVEPTTALNSGDTWSGTFTMSGTAGFTYSMAVGTGTASETNSVSISNETGSVDITVTWPTTVNEPGTVVGTVSSGELTAQGIASPITATYNPDSKSVEYSETPAIGGFSY